MLSPTEETKHMNACIIEMLSVLFFYVICMRLLTIRHATLQKIVINEILIYLISQGTVHKAGTQTKPVCVLWIAEIKCVTRIWRLYTNYRTIIKSSVASVYAQQLTSNSLPTAGIHQLKW